MPRPPKDLLGQRFGKLTVLGMLGCSNGRAIWNCKCDCGKECTAISTRLMRGQKSSCGCLKALNYLKANAASLKHGHAKRSGRTTEYFIWNGMVDRATNPNDSEWDDYGGRGITICEHWRKFENFLADMGPRPRGLTLDRKDNDRGYLCPKCFPPEGNCRWATRSEQNRNRRPETFVRHSEKMKAWWSEQTPEYKHARGKNSNRKGWITRRANASREIS